MKNILFIAVFFFTVYACDCQVWLVSYAEGHLQSKQSSWFLSQRKDSTRVKVAPWFVQRFAITAGLFVPVNNTDIQVGINGSLEGTEIDFEKDLGAAKTVGTLLAGLQWRASRRSRFDLSNYRVNRNSDKTLDKDINFGDSTYHVGATVKGVFNTNIFRFSYGYALLSKPKYEAGLLIGVHVVGTKTGISSSTENTDGSAGTNFDFTAPLPDFGLWGGYAFSKRSAVNAELDYLSLTVGNISGRILGYNVAFNYRMLDWLHLSLGYTGLNLKVDKTKEHLNGHFRWGNNGPSLTVTFAFGRKPWVTE